MHVLRNNLDEIITLQEDKRQKRRKEKKIISSFAVLKTQALEVRTVITFGSVPEEGMLELVMFCLLTWANCFVKGLEAGPYDLYPFISTLYYREKFV